MQANSLSKNAWFVHVAKWRSSKLTRAAYCTQHGLKLRSFIYWINQSKTAKANTPTGITLVPAKIKISTPNPTEHLVLRCPNGSTLSLPTNTPANWLGALLGQLI